MERKEFKTVINASREKVWQTLWDDDTYRKWTSVFSEGSRAVTDWNEGSKILFLNADGEGMVSSIAKKIENEYMSFKHLGYIDKDGNEDTESEQVKQWAGSEENYSLKDVQGKTEVTVVIDINDEYKDYFMETLPKALQKLKEISEQ